MNRTWRWTAWSIPSTKKGRNREGTAERLSALRVLKIYLGVGILLDSLIFLYSNHLVHIVTVVARRPSEGFYLNKGKISWSVFFWIEWGTFCFLFILEWDVSPFRSIRIFPGTILE